VYSTGVQTFRRVDQKYLGDIKCGVLKVREDLLDRSCKKYYKESKVREISYIQ
jgi:hypothetical protein